MNSATMTIWPFTMDFLLKASHWRSSATQRIRLRWPVQQINWLCNSIRTTMAPTLAFKFITRLSKAFRAVVAHSRQKAVNLARPFRMANIQRTSNVITSSKCHAKTKRELNYHFYHSNWRVAARVALTMLRWVNFTYIIMEESQVFDVKHWMNCPFHFFVIDLWRKQCQCSKSRPLVRQSNASRIFVIVQWNSHRFPHGFLIQWWWFPTEIWNRYGFYDTLCLSEQSFGPIKN